MIRPSVGDLARMRGVLDEFANCALLAVGIPASVDEWDRPAGSTTVWSGSALAYIGRDFTLKPGPVNRSVTPEPLEAGATADTLTILDGRSTLNIEAAIDTKASVLTIEDRRVTPPLTLTFRAQSVRHSMNGLLDYLVIGLRDPSAP